MENSISDTLLTIRIPGNAILTHQHTIHIPGDDEPHILGHVGRSHKSLPGQHIGLR